MCIRDRTQTIESAGTLDTLLPEAEVHNVTTKTAKKTTKTSGKVVTVTTPNGDIDWDMSVHWKTRAKTIIAKYGTTPDVLKSILGVETKGVIKQVQSSLEA